MAFQTVDVVSTKAAADLLGLSNQQVNRLLASGVLTRIARGLVDRSSVDRYLTTHQVARTRVWSEATAWAAVALLAGRKVTWLGGSVQTSRLRGHLRQIESVADLVTRARDRAQVHTFSGHEAAASRLAAGLVIVDQRNLDLGARTAGTVDGYLAMDDLAATVRRYALRESAEGRFTLRATGFDADLLRALAESISGARILAALDAASSLDARERGVGERVLADALEKFGARL